MTQKPITSLFRSRRRLIATVCLASIVIMIIGVGVFGSGVVYAQEKEEAPGWFSFEGFVAGIATFLLQYFTLPLIIIQKILQFANAIIAWLLFYLATYNNFIYNPIVEVGWVAVRDLANLGFITILIWIAFAMMIPGLGGGLDYKKALPKLLLMAVLINFSRMITGILIDISQVVVLTFLKPFRDDGPGILLGETGYFDTGTEAAYEKLKGSTLEGAGGIISMFINLMIQKVVDTIFLAMTAVIFCIMMVMFLGRLIALWILTIFSPFAFILSVVPQTQKYAKEWWGQLGKNLTAAPILAFFLWLTFIVAIQGGEAGKTISEIPAVLTKENLQKAVDACGSDEACKKRVEEEQNRAVAMQNKVASLGEGARGTIASITKLIITIALLMEGIKRAVESGAAGASIAKKIPAAVNKKGARFLAKGGVGKLLRGTGAVIGKVPGMGKFGEAYSALGKKGGFLDRATRAAGAKIGRDVLQDKHEAYESEEAQMATASMKDLVGKRARKKMWEGAARLTAGGEEGVAARQAARDRMRAGLRGGGQAVSQFAKEPFAAVGRGAAAAQKAWQEPGSIGEGLKSALETVTAVPTKAFGALGEGIEAPGMSEAEKMELKLIQNKVKKEEEDPTGASDEKRAEKLQKALHPKDGVQDVVSVGAARRMADEVDNKTLANADVGKMGEADVAVTSQRINEDVINGTVKASAGGRDSAARQLQVEAARAESRGNASRAHGMVDKKSNELMTDFRGDVAADYGDLDSQTKFVVQLAQKRGRNETEAKAIGEAFKTSRAGSKLEQGNDLSAERAKTTDNNAKTAYAFLMEDNEARNIDSWQSSPKGTAIRRNRDLLEGHEVKADGSIGEMTLAGRRQYQQITKDDSSHFNRGYAQAGRYESVGIMKEREADGTRTMKEGLTAEAMNVNKAATMSAIRGAGLDAKEAKKLQEALAKKGVSVSAASLMGKGEEGEEEIAQTPEERVKKRVEAAQRERRGTMSDKEVKETEEHFTDQEHAKDRVKDYEEAHGPLAGEQKEKLRREYEVEEVLKRKGEGKTDDERRKIKEHVLQEIERREESPAASATSPASAAIPEGTEVRDEKGRTYVRKGVDWKNTENGRTITRGTEFSKKLDEKAQPPPVSGAHEGEKKEGAGGEGGGSAVQPPVDLAPVVQAIEAMSKQMGAGLDALANRMSSVAASTPPTAVGTAAAGPSKEIRENLEAIQKILSALQQLLAEKEAKKGGGEGTS